MGTLILVIALVTEAAFAAYCIYTRSSQRQVRNYIRAGALAAFVLFALVSVIQWGTRWYLLAALLFVWAALGVWSLLAHRVDKKEYRPGRSVFRAIGTLLLVFITVIPALVFPQVTLPKPTGTHPVATALFSYTDPSRVETFSKTGGNREVNVEFWYPRDGGGPYPLVVFSHGTGATKTSNTSTFQNLASSGYVVCSIDHPYHAMYTVDAAGKRTTVDPAYIQQYLAVTRNAYDDATDLKLEQGWLNLHAADVNFVLDTVLQQAKAPGASGVYALIDPTKIGLFGHSLGGETAAQVARQRAEAGKNDIAAVIDLDADLAGEYLGIQNGKPVISQKPYPVPILVLFSDTLWKPINAIPDKNETVAVMHVIATAPKAYVIHLPGTDHLSLTDLPLVSPLMAKVIGGAVPKAGGVEASPYATLEKMNGIVLQFFNVFLKGEGSFNPAGME